MFPRREHAACHWFCNEWLGYLSEGISRGMQAGRLQIPEGLPMLWNVYDYGGCSFDTVRGGRGLSGRHEACGQTMHGHAADVLMWPMCEAAPPPILPVPPRLPGCLSLVCVVQEGRNLCAAAPLLSLIKQAEQLDVLVPAFKPRYEPQWVPWSEKSDLAFFRWGGGRAGGWGGAERCC